MMQRISLLTVLIGPTDSPGRGAKVTATVARFHTTHSERHTGLDIAPKCVHVTCLHILDGDRATLEGSKESSTRRPTSATHGLASEALRRTPATGRLQSQNASQACQQRQWHTCRLSLQMSTPHADARGPMHCRARRSIVTLALPGKGSPAVQFEQAAHASQAARYFASQRIRHVLQGMQASGASSSAQSPPAWLCGKQVNGPMAGHKAALPCFAARVPALDKEALLFHKQHQGLLSPAAPKQRQLRCCFSKASKGRCNQCEPMVQLSVLTAGAQFHAHVHTPSVLLSQRPPAFDFALHKSSTCQTQARTR
mmetsp:Transcript_8126/g.24521  ORF Transcript_8126/g.24521 Transcript_8126/m.24521 type:complete len:311 (-) Transcript_8126:2425-3357(-)